jgi:hypothetical protein
MERWCHTPHRPGGARRVAKAPAGRWGEEARSLDPRKTTLCRRSRRVPILFHEFAAQSGHYGYMAIFVWHASLCCTVRCKWQPGSAISCVDRSGRCWSGNITAAWIKEIGDSLRTFVVVQSHEVLSEMDAPLSPFANRPEYKSQLVYSETTQDSVIIDPSLIIWEAPS